MRLYSCQQILFALMLHLICKLHIKKVRNYTFYIVCEFNRFGAFNKYTFCIYHNESTVCSILSCYTALAQNLKRDLQGVRVGREVPRGRLVQGFHAHPVVPISITFTRLQEWTDVINNNQCFTDRIGFLSLNDCQ